MSPDIARVVVFNTFMYSESLQNPVAKGEETGTENILWAYGNIMSTILPNCLWTTHNSG